VLPLLLALLCVVPPATPLPSLTRVRPISDTSRSILNGAMKRSPTVVRLVSELQQLDVIVYIELGLEPMATVGMTSILTTAGATRMLRVVVSARLDPRRRMEVLGHELQHALEIASANGVTNDATLHALYRRIGYPISNTSYETDGARVVESQVRRELTRPAQR
jgi:hypothetical protein